MSAPPQSRKMSFAETVTSTVLGYIINQSAQLVVFPVVGINIPLSANIELGIFFTVISVARGFVLRRCFERWRVYAHGRL